MAEITISKSLQTVTAGNTSDNTITFGSFGQTVYILVRITPIAGPIYLALNADATGGVSVAATETKELRVRDGVDVLHFKQTANGDTFTVAVVDLV